MRHSATAVGKGPSRNGGSCCRPPRPPSSAPWSLTVERRGTPVHELEELTGRGQHCLFAGPAIHGQLEKTALSQAPTRSGTPTSRPSSQDSPISTQERLLQGSELCSRPFPADGHSPGPNLSRPAVSAAVRAQPAPVGQPPNPSSSRAPQIPPGPHPARKCRSARKIRAPKRALTPARPARPRPGTEGTAHLSLPPFQPRGGQVASGGVAVSLRVGHAPRSAALN